MQDVNSITARAMPNNYVIAFEDNLGASSSLDLNSFPDVVSTDNETNFKVYDLRNLYSAEDMKKNKIKYYSVGRPNTN